jgi:hypothetical protein
METNETPKPLDYRAVLEAMEAQYAALGRAIAEMRVVAGVSGSTLGDGIGISQVSGVLSPSDVPAGAFHGKSMITAAVLYLRMVKQKQKTGDIAAALLKGGRMSGAKPAKYNGQIHSQLDRASKREGSELIKVQGAYWALREWYPANVRASMGTTVAALGKKRKKNKKRSSASASPKATEKPKAVQAQPVAPSLNGSNGHYRPPNEESTEGRILATMRKDSVRLWTPKEVAEESAIPRVQTAVFLMGKLAHRGFLTKRDDGLYVFNHA